MAAPISRPDKRLSEQTLEPSPRLQVKNTHDQESILDEELNDMVDKLVKHGWAPDIITQLIEEASKYGDVQIRNLIFESYVKIMLKNSH